MNPRQSANRVTRLRLRDGDGCWLCGELIDFTLNPHDQMAKSIDHVQPKSAGGQTVLPNLKLAHRLCNSRRGSAWEGESCNVPAPLPVQVRRSRGGRKDSRWDSWAAARQVPGGLVIGDDPVMDCA